MSMNLNYGRTTTDCNLSNANVAQFCRLADIDCGPEGSTPIPNEEFHHKLNQLLALYDGLCERWTIRLLSIHAALDEASPNAKIFFS